MKQRTTSEIIILMVVFIVLLLTSVIWVPLALATVVVVLGSIATLIISFITTFMGYAEAAGGGLRYYAFPFFAITTSMGLGVWLWDTREGRE